MSFELQRQEWMVELEVLRHSLKQGVQDPDPELDEELAVALEALSAPMKPPPVGELAVRERRQIDQIGQGCIVTSLRGIIKRVNRAAERHLKCTWLVGQPMLVFVALQERQRFMDERKDFKKRGIRIRSDWAILLQPLERPASMTTMQVHALRNEEEQTEGFMWLFQTPLA
jgi:PAS domain-containing protein